MIWLSTLLLLAKLHFAVSETAYFCEDGYSGLQNSEDCYRVITSTLYAYDDARKFCIDEGGNLTSIHNIFEDTLIKNFGMNGLLLGLRYYEADNAYKWSDGSPLNYKNYKDGFEADKDYDGYCTAYRNGKWDNADCDTDKLMFVCKRPAVSYTVTPSNACPNNSIYYFDERPLYSPGYPNYFAAGLSCEYNLIAKNGYVINLYLSGLHMVCETSFFNPHRLLDADRGKPTIGICQIDDNGYEVTLPTNRVRIEFYAGSNAGKWKLDWKGLKKDPVRNPTALLSKTVTSNGNEYFQCSSDYTLYADTCYRLVSEVQLYYQSAVEFCSDEGADLVSIHSSPKNLLQLIKLIQGINRYKRFSHDCGCTLPSDVSPINTYGTYVPNVAPAVHERIS